jgi:hypothetical protein
MEAPKAARSRPWTIVVAAVIPPIYFFPIAVFLMAQGPTEDFGDLSGTGRLVAVLGLAEVVLSCGIWLRAKTMWMATVVFRLLVVVALIFGNVFEQRLVFMIAACWIIPAVLSFVFVVLEPSRKWCGVE